jgi:hypothetical protein
MEMGDSQEMFVFPIREQWLDAPDDQRSPWHCLDVVIKSGWTTSLHALVQGCDLMSWSCGR